MHGITWVIMYVLCLVIRSEYGSFLICSLSVGYLWLRRLRCLVLKK